MKKIIKRIPVVNTLCRWVYYSLVEPRQRFPGSGEYWQERYSKGGQSGDGSYGTLALFKAEVINGMVENNGIGTVIELGCGDGNQLVMANYPSYLGVDISSEAINICRRRFAGDETKSFVSSDDYAGEKAELALSLDVLYHLVEDSVFHSYMKSLFDAATRFVVIYSSNTDVQQKLQGQHVRHREFTDWITKNTSGWELIRHIPNVYPYSESDTDGSFADFYIYALSSK